MIGQRRRRRTPDGYPIPSFYWDAAAGLLSAGMSYARSTTGTYFNSSGVLTTAAINEARYTYAYNGTAWVPKGYLSERSITNKLLYSNGFTTVNWSATDITYTNGAITGPDGTLSGTLVTEGSAGNSNNQQGPVAGVVSTKTNSIFLKRGNCDWVRVRLLGVSAVVNAWFNLATGTVGTVQAINGATGQVARIINVGNGWYRCCPSGLLAAETDAGIGFFSAGGDGVFTRQANATYYVFGAQQEDLGYATSYIATTTANVTRGADNMSGSLSSVIPNFNTAQGTLITECETLTSGSLQYISNISDGGSNNRISQIINGSINAFQVWVGGANQCSIGPAYTIPRIKMGSAWAANDFRSYINGVAGTPDVSGTIPTGLTTFYVGGVSGTASLDGTIKSIAYYNTPLTNMQLQALSA